MHEKADAMQAAMPELYLSRSLAGWDSTCGHFENTVLAVSP